MRTKSNSLFVEDTPCRFPASAYRIQQIMTTTSPKFPISVTKSNILARMRSSFVPTLRYRRSEKNGDDLMKELESDFGRIDAMDCTNHLCHLNSLNIK